jgi:riboflavin synthase
MFTGLVAEIGSVASAVRAGGSMRFTVRAPGVAGDLSPGDSVAVNGVCQTVTSKRGGEFDFDAVRETLQRTNLGGLGPGSEVNLEPALRLGDRIGGHLVSGHVDATGAVRRRRTVGAGNIDFAVQVPDELVRYIAVKGSIALDGVSLTVAALKGALVEVSVIPFTLENTTMRNWRVGTRVNIEVDQLARYLSTGDRPGGGGKA